MEGKVIKTQDLATLLFTTARNPKGQQLAWNFVKENWTHLLKKLVFVYILIVQLVKNPPAMQRPRLNSWGGKIRWRRDRLPTPVFLGFLGGSAGKKSTCNAGDLGSIPELGRCPGEGKGYPVQCSGLENSMGSIVHGVTKSRAQLSDFTMCILPPRYFSCLKPSVIRCSLKHMNDTIFTQMV